MIPDFHYILHDAGAGQKYHELTGRHKHSVPVQVRSDLQLPDLA
jgi:hypothetical protein